MYIPPPSPRPPRLTYTMQVFPATHFEDFIVHHRTNNKNGRRGESIPGVSMAMLRVWAEQFIRDGDFLQVRHWTLLP